MKWFPVSVRSSGPRMSIARSSMARLVGTGAICGISSLYDGFLRLIGSRVKFRINHSPYVVSEIYVPWICTFVIRVYVRPSASSVRDVVGEVVVRPVRIASTHRWLAIPLHVRHRQCKEITFTVARRWLVYRRYSSSAVWAVTNWRKAGVSKFDSLVFSLSSWTSCTNGTKSRSGKL